MKYIYNNSFIRDNEIIFYVFVISIIIMIIWAFVKAWRILNADK